MKKILDYDGTVKGYQIGNYYLLKRYTFKNYFDWIITKNFDDANLMMCEFDKKVNNNEIEFANSFKEGKEILLKRI